MYEGRCIARPPARQSAGMTQIIKRPALLTPIRSTRGCESRERERKSDNDISAGERNGKPAIMSRGWRGGVHCFPGRGEAEIWGYEFLCAVWDVFCFWRRLEGLVELDWGEGRRDGFGLSGREMAWNWPMVFKGWWGLSEL